MPCRPTVARLITQERAFAAAQQKVDQLQRDPVNDTAVGTWPATCSIETVFTTLTPLDVAGEVPQAPAISIVITKVTMQRVVLQDLLLKIRA